MENIVEFHDDPDHRILFASDAGGVGLNLQHASNCVINLELPWNPAVLAQRIARVHRLGQKGAVNVVLLVSEGSFDLEAEQVGGGHGGTYSPYIRLSGGVAARGEIHKQQKAGQ